MHLCGVVSILCDFGSLVHPDRWSNRGDSTPVDYFHTWQADSVAENNEIICISYVGNIEEDGRKYSDNSKTFPGEAQ